MERRPKILLVGSFVLDQIAETRVFPREGQTVLGERFSKAPGGKGANQAVQAARLGADVTMVGKLGRDANGVELLAACREAGVHTEHVLFDDNTASGCAVVLLEEKPDGQTKNRIVVIPGANMTLTTEDVAFLEEEIGRYDLVLLQLEIPMAVNERVAAYARARNVPVMLNAAPSAPLPDTLLSGLAFLSPNEHEAADLTGIPIPHSGRRFDRDAAAHSAQVLRDKGVQNVLITMGEAGAALVSADGLLVSPCAEGINAVDPTAAGDSFIGAFSVGLCCGWSMEDALRFASHTAALTVSTLGAMPSLPKLEAVEHLLAERFGSCPDTACLKGGGAQ